VVEHGRPPVAADFVHWDLFQRAQPRHVSRRSSSSFRCRTFLGCLENDSKMVLDAFLMAWCPPIAFVLLVSVCDRAC
jgi:hypothetical protein